MGSDPKRRTALVGANLGWHTSRGARSCPARAAKSPARSPLVVQGGRAEGAGIRGNARTAKPLQAVKVVAAATEKIGHDRLTPTSYGPPPPGPNRAGARALWRATGMKDGDFHKPIIAIANSFTQFVPGHVHLKDLGQLVIGEIERAGGVGKEFNTIAVDDGIAMGHDGMLYSLPSRDIIADSVEYMCNAHTADALVCISNCDKITPGMLMAAMRLNIPVIFVSGGPMEAGKTK